MDEVVVAFDFGEKRIGVAVGNTLMKSANPHCIIRSERKDLRWQGVEKVIREWQPTRLVVGRPNESRNRYYERQLRWYSYVGCNSRSCSPWRKRQNKGSSE